VRDQLCAHVHNSFLIELLEPRIAPATVFTWDGGGNDNLWSSPANWVGDVAPSPGSALVFNVPKGGYYSPVHNDFPDGTVFDSIVVHKARRYDDFTLAGNAIELEHGLKMPVEETELAIDIKLRADQTFTFSYKRAFYVEFAYAGKIELNGRTLTVEAKSADQKDTFRFGGEIGDTSAEKNGTLVYHGRATLEVPTQTEPVKLVANGGGIAVGNNPAMNVTLDGGTLEFFKIVDVIANKGTVKAGYFESVRGDLEMHRGSAFRTTVAELDENDPDVPPPLTVEGSVTLNQPLLKLYLSRQPSFGAEIVIIKNDGIDPVVGQFAGLPEGALFNRLAFPQGTYGIAPSSPLFRITYAGGDGNDVAVIAATPPPAVSADRTVVRYTDIDGDAVTLKIEGAILKPQNVVLSAPNAIGGQELIWLKAPQWRHVHKISITADQQGDGDGHVNVRQIEGYRIKTLVVDGDIATLSAHRIDSLSARSLGVRGGRSLAEQYYDSDVSLFRLDDANIRSDVATRLDLTRVDKLTIGGSLTGSITIGSAGAIRVDGDVRGTSEPRSGLITLYDRPYPRPASIYSIKIGGSLIGGSGLDSGAILAPNPVDPNEITTGDGSIRKIEIGGSVRSARGDESGSGGSIRAAGSIGAVKIHGSILGTPDHPVIIAADGGYFDETDPALGNVYVGGDVKYGLFNAGDAFSYRQGSASIKGIVVQGNWIASSAVAGVKRGDDHMIGTGDDHLARSYFNRESIAQIGAIIVYGKVGGTKTSGDSFGIVAEQIGFVHIGGQTFSMSDAPRSKEDFIYVDTGEAGPNGARSDFTIHEVH